MNTDILVIGAGPAGSTLARILADNGREVVLIDKSSFPRAKACGGGVPSRTVRQLGLDLSGIGPNRIDRVCLNELCRKPFIMPVDDAALVVDRARFDNLLAEKAREAGAVFLEKTPVKDISPSQAGWHVRTGAEDGTAIDARIICICDGARSKTAHIFGAANTYYGFAVCGWIPVPESAPEASHSTAVFNFGCGQGGYGWLFPYEGRYNIGLGYSYWPVRDIRSRLAAMCRRETLTGGVSPAKVYGGALPRFDKPRLWYAKDGIYLAGDAAGLVDPLTGEGIHFAIESACYAADAILSSSEEVYTKNVRENIADGLNVAKHFATRWRWIPKWLITTLLGRKSVHKYAELFVQQYTGEISYQQLYDKMHGLGE